MLRMEHIRPGCCAAYEGDKETGRCCYRQQEGVTGITSLWLLDAADEALLDGLIRAVVFYGMKSGCVKARITHEAAGPYGQALERLGFAPGNEIFVPDLPSRCGHK